MARLGWLVRLRWVAVGGIVLGTLLVRPILRAIGAQSGLPTRDLLLVAVAILAYNLWLRADVATLKRRAADASGPALARLAAFHVGLDLLALACLIHLTGGMESPLAFFLVFHIIIAGVLLGPAISLVTAAVASGLYMAVTGLEYASVLPHYHLVLPGSEQWRDPVQLLAMNAVLVMTLFSVAYLTTSITARLRQHQRELQATVEASQAQSRELQALNAQLQRVDDERTRFMTLVTHELRAPLSIIYSAMDLVLGGYTTGDQTRDVLSRAQRRASDMLEMVDDLLELTRAREDGSRRERRQAAHPGGPLRDVVEFMRVEAEHKGLALVVDVEPVLPLALASPDEMKLVWSNVLSNAVKYTPEGGSVHVSLGSTPEHVVGIVEDSGIGIPADDLPHVFEEFFRSSNARQVSTYGSGVGLAVVQHIVDNLGGRIDVESEVGRGTKVQFRLPRADARTKLNLPAP